jgi:site-specific DNA-methyltransferase (adenine-specific)
METLILGDCLEKLKELDANSIDSVVTDPPYGLKFMNKHWDYDVPKVEIWKEVMRVLKPGGHVLSFGGTRTYHRMVVNIEDAGFEIRDAIQWLYGSGFPKSHNLKEQWQGWGTALKPSCEIICLARKPLEKELTVAENVLKWGVGALNIDESRIEAKDLESLQKNWDRHQSQTMQNDRPAYGKFQAIDLRDRNPEGRWPANTIFDEEAAALLDEQSGPCKSGGSIKAPKSSTRFKNTHSQNGSQPNWEGYQDLGGASRFFYCAKASKRERNAGLEGMSLVSYQSGMAWAMPLDDKGKDRDRFKAQAQNHHPTVKPLKLMQYLIKLITPPQGTVLDLFMGSGSTGVACRNLGYNFVGIEMNLEYFEIAKKRIEVG